MITSFQLFQYNIQSIGPIHLDFDKNENEDSVEKKQENYTEIKKFTFQGCQIVRDSLEKLIKDKIEIKKPNEPIRIGLLGAVPFPWK